MQCQIGGQLCLDAHLCLGLQVQKQEVEAMDKTGVAGPDIHVFLASSPLRCRDMNTQGASLIAGAPIKSLCTAQLVVFFFIIWPLHC
jgi:hypothetical protein